MKKVYIYNQHEPSVKDTEKVHMEMISSISNGSTDIILCDCLDSVEYGERTNKTKEMLSKLKVNGEITFKTVNLDLMARSIYLDQLDLSSINNIIHSCSSIVNDEFFTACLVSDDRFLITENINDQIFRTTTIKRIK